MKRREMACAAASRVGATSRAPIEREVSIAMIAVASSERSEMVRVRPREADQEAGDGEQQQRRRQMPAPGRHAVDDVRQQRRLRRSSRPRCTRRRWNQT